MLNSLIIILSCFLLEEFRHLIQAPGLTFVSSVFTLTLILLIYILKEKRNATDKNIIFECLNDGLVKSLLKISY